MKVEQTCLTCEKKFLAYPREVEKGGGKFCSRECRIRYQKRNTIQRSCLVCGTAIEVKFSARKDEGKFCSRKCHSEYRLSQRIAIECRWCKTIFRTPSNPNRQRRFCGWFCYCAWNTNVLVSASQEILKNAVRPCKRCGKLLVRYSSQFAQGRGKYCSKACANAAKIRKVSLRCAFCRKQFLRSRNRIYGALQYCSNACRLFSSGQRIQSMTIYTPGLLSLMSMHRGSHCAFPGCTELQASGEKNRWHACVLHRDNIYNSLRIREKNREKVLFRYGLGSTNP